MEFTVNSIEPSDIPHCVEILNFIIRKGGTTAYEKEFTLESFDNHYRSEPKICLVVKKDGVVLGFQGSFDLGDGELSIASFTDQVNPVAGAGRALFEATRQQAKKMGYRSILAKITSDNASGLGFYSRMGFVDDHVIKNDLIRANGIPVDRIIKRYVL